MSPAPARITSPGAAVKGGRKSGGRGAAGGANEQAVARRKKKLLALLTRRRTRATLPRGFSHNVPLLNIRLFGELSAVDSRGNALSIGNRRTQALLAFLALSIEGERTVKDFAALFGGDDPQLTAAALTRDLHFALRFISPDLLRHDRDSVRLHP